MLMDALKIFNENEMVLFKVYRIQFICRVLFNIGNKKKEEEEEVFFVEKFCFDIRRRPAVYPYEYSKVRRSNCQESKQKKSHIKKPLNAFMLFMREQRAQVVQECTLRESAAINQILGRKVKFEIEGRRQVVFCFSSSGMNSIEMFNRNITIWQEMNA